MQRMILLLCFCFILCILLLTVQCDNQLQNGSLGKEENSGENSKRVKRHHDVLYDDMYYDESDYSDTIRMRKPQRQPIRGSFGMMARRLCSVGGEYCSIRHNCCSGHCDIPKKRCTGPGPSNCTPRGGNCSPRGNCCSHHCDVPNRKCK